MKDKFTAWMTSVCFQRPPKHSLDLAESAWNEQQKTIDQLREDLSAANISCGKHGEVSKRLRELSLAEIDLTAAWRSRALAAEIEVEHTYTLYKSLKGMADLCVDKLENSLKEIEKLKIVLRLARGIDSKTAFTDYYTETMIAIDLALKEVDD